MYTEIPEIQQHVFMYTGMGALLMHVYGLVLIINDPECKKDYMEDGHNGKVTK